MEPIYLSIKQKETSNRILKKSSSLTGILLYFRKKYVKYINISLIEKAVASIHQGYRL